MQRQWVVFDFTGERPSSLMSIPSSWIVEEPKNKANKKTSWCYWPNKGSADEKRLDKLIKICSDPHPESWSMLPGRIKGSFKSLKEAESFVGEIIGTISTNTDIELDGTNILGLEHQAALKVKENYVTKQTGSIKANVEPSTRTLNTTPSRTNSKSKMVNTTPGTNKTNFNGNKLVNTIPSKTNSNSDKLVKTAPGLSKINSNSSKMLNTTPSTSRTSVSEALTSPKLTGMYCCLLATHPQYFIIIFSCMP